MKVNGISSHGKLFKGSLLQMNHCMQRKILNALPVVFITQELRIFYIIQLKITWYNSLLKCYF